MGHRVTTLNVNTIEPAGNTLTIGASGDSVVLADDVKANTYKDAGGNTLFTSDGSGNLSSINSGFGDKLKLLQTQTFTNQATISFTSGIDSTYKEYIFKFFNLNPATDNVDFLFQVNAVGQSGYNELMHTTSILEWGGESSGGNAAYLAGGDQDEGTAFQELMQGMGNGADESGGGLLHLYDPANTTYVKHFHTRTQSYERDNQSFSTPTAGYIDTTAAIDEIQFKMSSGNFDGTIKMYGVL